MLALATCFCNDLYREAAKRNIVVSGADVACTGYFGAAGDAGSNFTYQVNAVSDAPPAVIEALVKGTDKIAEVHNALRKGLSFTLA